MVDGVERAKRARIITRRRIKMKKKLLTMMIVGVMGAAMLAGCGGSEEADVADASVQDEVQDEVQEDNDEAAGTEVTFVDGFYAADGNGSDFMIAFYEGAAGDIAYVNDGTGEVFAEYIVENAQLDDGTEYLLVTVGAMQMGYLENGEDIYLITDDGEMYAAARLTEEEADAIAAAVASAS